MSAETRISANMNTTGYNADAPRIAPRDLPALVRPGLSWGGDTLKTGLKGGTMKRVALAFLSALLIAGCAAGPKTASGRPELEVRGLTVEQVRDKLIERWASRGWTIEKADGLLLVVAKKSDSFAHSMLAGSNYDPQPWWRARITILKTEDGARIFGAIESVTNYGSAFERRNDLSDARAGRELQDALEQTFGKAPSIDAKEK